MTDENGAENEFATLSDVESNEDADRRVVAWLKNRVPEDVPSEVDGAVRSAIEAELEGITSSATEDAHPVEGASKVVRRRRPSLGVATAALIVLTIGLNVLVAWRSDRRIAAVVGNHGERSSDSINNSNTRATRKVSIAALFEFNVHLIQREVNHERIESNRIGFGERRQATRPTEEGHSEEIPDRSGAAVCPGFGIQRRSKLASFVTA